MRDIVVDTNVFVHAGNPGVADFLAASRLVDLIRQSSVMLCHDPGPIYPPERCRSLIFAEYWESIGPPSPVRAVITALILADRFKAVPTLIRAEHGRWLVNNVPNRRDRTFVRVAANTASRILVTHDNDDFSPSVRRSIGQRIQVVFDDAVGACERMAEAEEGADDG